jgi:hypothetical protein
MSKQPPLRPPLPEFKLVSALREQRASIGHQRFGLVEHLRAMLRRQDAELARHPLISTFIAEGGWPDGYEARSSPWWLANRRAAFFAEMIEDLRKRTRSLPSLSMASSPAPPAAGIERLARLLLRVYREGGRSAV